MTTKDKLQFSAAITVQKLRPHNHIWMLIYYATGTMQPKIFRPVSAGVVYQTSQVMVENV